MSKQKQRQNHELRSHTNISPSSGMRVALCPASLKLSSKFPPQETSEAAIEGTRAHERLESQLLAFFEKRDHDYKKNIFKEDCDSDLIDIYKELTNPIRLFRCDPKLVEVIDVSVERKFKIFKKKKDFEQVLGTADFAYSFQAPLRALDSSSESSERKIVVGVCDLKYGRSPVSCLDETFGVNVQLALYAFGYIRYLVEEKGLKQKDVFGVRLRIFQPRVSLEESEFNFIEISIKELMTLIKQLHFMFGVAYSLKEEDLKDRSLYSKEERACTFCRAKAGCPVFEEFSGVTLLEPYDGKQPPISQIPIDKLKAITLNASKIKKFLDEVTAYVEKMAVEDFSEFENEFKFVRAKTQTRWKTKTLENVCELSRVTGIPVDELVETKEKLISITNITKKLGKEGKEKIKNFIEKPIGTRVLAPIDDKREAIEDVILLEASESKCKK